MEICFAVGGFILIFLTFIYFIYWLRKNPDHVPTSNPVSCDLDNDDHGQQSVSSEPQDV